MGCGDRQLSIMWLMRLAVRHNFVNSQPEVLHEVSGRRISRWCHHVGRASDVGLKHEAKTWALHVIVLVSTAQNTHTVSSTMKLTLFLIEYICSNIDLLPNQKWHSPSKVKCRKSNSRLYEINAPLHIQFLCFKQRAAFNMTLMMLKLLDILLIPTDENQLL